jgi:hypothetical protein
MVNAVRATMQSQGRLQPVVDGGTLALLRGCVGSTETTWSSVDVETRRKFRGVSGFFTRQARRSDGKSLASLGGRGWWAQ